MEKSVVERKRAIPRERLPEHRIQIKTWSVNGQTFIIPNMWYDLDKDEFVRYSSRYGLYLVKKFRVKSIFLVDVNSKYHTASCKKLIEQNMQS